MKDYRVTAKDQGRITLRSDDTFTLAFVGREDGRPTLTESTAAELADCVSLASLKALMAKIEREENQHEAAAYRDGKLGQAIEIADRA